MSAQQRKLQDLKLKLGLSSFHQSSRRLVPLQQIMKTLPDIPSSPQDEIKQRKLQKITSIYRSPQKNLVITNKRTSIQRMSISQQLKNLVKYTSQLKLDGLDALKNQVKNSDTLVTSLQKSQNIDILLVGVADGHGPNASQITQMITHQAMSGITNLINTTPIIGLSLMINKSFQKIYYDVEQNMLQQTDMDVKCNGSSLLSLVVINKTIYCANLGDSKATYFYKKDIDPSGPKEVRKFGQKNLNFVHDTNNSNEVERIINKGGKIDQALYRGKKSGSLKVWVPKQNYPGIKITRCFGNTQGKSIGIGSEPDIIEYKIPKSGYLLIGTTGIWEKMDILMIDQILDSHFPPSCQEDVDQVLKLIGNETRKYWDPSNEGLIDMSLVLIYIDIN